MSAPLSDKNAAFFSQLSEANYLHLARQLFEYQESILPEGQTWNDLSEGDVAFWCNSVKVVIRESRKL